MIKLLTLSVPEPENFGNYLLKDKGFSYLRNPDVISLMPQTVGAKITLILLLLFTVVLIFFLVRRWVKNKYRREALRSLKEQNGDTNINHILRVAMRVAYPKASRGAIFGSHWQDLLNSTVNSKQALFSREMVNYMEQQQYSGNVMPFDTELQSKCLNAANSWIKTHKGGK